MLLFPKPAVSLATKQWLRKGSKKMELKNQESSNEERLSTTTDEDSWSENSQSDTIFWSVLRKTEIEPPLKPEIAIVNNKQSVDEKDGRLPLPIPKVEYP